MPSLTSENRVKFYENIRMKIPLPKNVIKTCIIGHVHVVVLKYNVRSEKPNGLHFAYVGEPIKDACIYLYPREYHASGVEAWQNSVIDFDLGHSGVWSPAPESFSVAAT